ncbi:MAG: Ig-like domain-containing protein [Acidobacteriota bacterium]|nr:Ig-like domain-containing protein [Acidobacteriota bacterium]
MTTKPERGTDYGVRPEHCEAIEEINCREDCSSNLTLTEGEDCPCCFFCTIPPLQDRCLLAPALCSGGYADPSEGYCIYRETTWVVIGVVEEEHLIGTTLTYFTLSEMTSTSIDCYTWNLGGDPPQETSQESVQPGEGPLLFVRSRYPEGLAGAMPLSGVARDDTYGIASLSFWIDGVPAAVSGLQMGLYDPHTCTERPATGCDANSRFEAMLDVSGLADGTHTLQVLAVNNRVVDPIPTYYEIPIEVRNAGSCSGDGTGPTVSLNQPAAGASIQGTVGVTCSASDSSGVEQVELYAAGAWKQSDPTAPYSFSLDTTGYPDGPLELRCRAEDACGNASFSAPVAVTVANGAPTTVTFSPTDDTFAHQDQPTSVFGAYNFLRLRTFDGGHGRHGYLKFQLSGITGAVTSAKLRFRTQDMVLPEALSLYKLATTGWSEQTLTWNNAPLDVVQSTTLPGPFAAETWHELYITPLVTGDGTLSLGLATTANQGKLDLWTKESLYPPRLDVTFVPSAIPVDPSGQ